VHHSAIAGDRNICRVRVFVRQVMHVRKHLRSGTDFYDYTWAMWDGMSCYRQQHSLPLHPVCYKIKKLPRPRHPSGLN